MNTRVTLIAAAIIVASLIVAVAMFPPDDTGRGRPQPTDTNFPFRNSPTAHLDRDAVRAAEQQVTTLFDKCGAEYVTRFSEWVPLGPGVLRPVSRMERYLEPRFTSEPQPLTDPDRLNHIDWSGSVLMNARAWASTERGAYGEWRAFEGRRLTVKRKNAQWEVTSDWLNHLREIRAARGGCAGIAPRPLNR